jgi:hypothetical protein
MNDTSNRSGVWNTRMKVAFLVFAGIGAFLLIAEHRAHVLPYLPWLILAACPLMHVFMHRGHGSHGHHGGPDEGRGGSGSDTDKRPAAQSTNVHRHDGSTR